MRYKVFEEPTHPKSNRIMFSCETCGRLVWEKPNSYAKNSHHFCNRKCKHKYMEKYTEEERLIVLKKRHREYRKKNPEKVRKWRDNYKKKHADVIAHGKARYKARRRGANGSHTLEEWNEVIKAAGGKCVMCGKVKRLTKDHIIPISMGGSDNICNIQPLCSACNSRKGTRIVCLIY